MNTELSNTVGTPPQPPASPSIRRGLLISAVLALFGVALSWWYEGMSIALIVFIVVLLQGLLLVINALLRRWHQVKLAAARVGIWSAVVALGAVSHNHFTDVTRARAESLVAALKAYHAREGRYPDVLEALVPKDIKAVPVSVQSLSRERPFRYDTREGQYTLSYFPGFRLMTTYRSESGKWQTLD